MGSGPWQKPVGSTRQTIPYFLKTCIIGRLATNSKMVLNFQGVAFMSSAMIGKVILLNKKCKTDNVNLKLSNISPNVMEVFKIMRLNKVLSIYDDEAKAIAAFDKKGWFR